MIGHVPDDRTAATFSGFLRTRGVDNEVERESDGTYAVWVRSDDQVDEGTRMLEEYRRDPGASIYGGAAEAGRRIEEAEAAQEDEARNRMHGRRDIWRANAPALTYILIFISVTVFILTGMGEKVDELQRFSITEYEVSNFSITWNGGLPEVRSGEVWRLVTPIFIHYGLLHIILNMLWLKDLGAVIEVRLGTTYLGVLVIVIAVISNLTQYLLVSPGFGGMSGVVYGLLGYVWMKGRYDSGAGMALPQHVVVMMMIWFVICFTGAVGSIANGAHAGGLIVGVIWGYLSARRSRYFVG